MGENNDVWKKPKNVPYPSVWSRFDGRKEINGQIPKFWIQDIPEDQLEVVANYMVTSFCDDEPLCQFSKLTSDKVSMEEMYQVWSDVLKQKMGIICYMENPKPNGKPIIAGMNCTCITSKNNPSEYNFKGVAANKVLDAMDYVGHLNDYFAILGEDHLLYAFGLYVLPEFRGQALGTKLLEAREPLCKAVGLKGTITAFSATVSQKLASRLGYKTISEVSYEELKKINPTLDFPGIELHTKDIKYMYKMY